MTEILILLRAADTVKVDVRVCLGAADHVTRSLNTFFVQTET